MDIAAIREYVSKEIQEVTNLIGSALHSDVGMLTEINASLLEHKGKMLRPILSIISGKACGNGSVNSDTLHIAAASEVLHNATLIHDDIADCSDTRRGTPTLTSLIGPSTAVLVGDFWLAKAMKLVMQTERREKVANLFSETLSNLSEGEMFQLERAEHSDTVLEDYYRIIYCKTASLFVVSCVAAAQSVDAQEGDMEAIREYARNFGMAFQIKDDIFDYGGGENIGKPLGIDLREKKITLPLLCAISGSTREEQIREMVSRIDSHPEYCGEIKDFVTRNDGVDKAEAVLNSFVQKSKESAERLPQSEARNILMELADYNRLRTV